jgi:hypothetical protein
MTLACDLTEGAHQGNDAAVTGSGAQNGEPIQGAGSTSNAPDGQVNPASGDANVPVRTDGGATAASGSDAGTVAAISDAGMANSGRDAASQRPDWEGLVTLDASVTIGPDGAVISGGFPHYDAAAAGPVLDAKSQAACLTLVTNLCNRVADCQISLGQPAARRSQLVASCQDTFLRGHNCNRAISTASGFSACAESVKTRDCQAAFASDFATACLDQITFMP